MLINRRRFLHTGSMATASMLLPRFLLARQALTGSGPGGRVLVVLQLSGGNDGLNTVIPIRNDIYYKLRPALGIAGKQTLALNGELALHPALSALKKLYDEGSLAILNGVGYPNPERSHFRSMDIWQTASGADQYLNTGWVGRYLDAQCGGCEKPTQALELDDTLSLALKGARIKGIALKDPRQLYESSRQPYYRDLMADYHNQGDRPVDYLYKTLSTTLSSAEYIFQQSGSRPSSGKYPSSQLGKSLHTIASLILSEINTTVYYVSLGSFDTHVNQQRTQERLFGELNQALGAFVEDMKENHRFEDVLVMSFSEFGRRVAQNASGGTDHGTANNMFLLSGSLKGKGILNPGPDLQDLVDGDLKYAVDFRDVYATILAKWLQVEDRSILDKQGDFLHFI